MKIKKFIKEYYGWIILLVGFLAMNTSVISYADDVYFAEAIKEYGSIGAWADYYYNFWGGRVVPHAILVLLLQLPGIVFASINAIMMELFVLLFNVVVLDGKYLKNPKIYIAMAIVWIYMMPQGMLLNMMFKASTVLYLWTLPALLLAIWPSLLLVRGNKPEKKHYILALLGGLYATGSEQTGAILVAMLLILGIYNIVVNKKFTWSVFVIGIIFVAVYLAAMLAPGNSYRTIEETVAWKDDFATYNVFEKLLMGISYMLTYISSHGAIFMFIIASVVTAIVFKQKKSLFIRIVTILVEIYYALNYINWIIIDKYRVYHFLIFGKVYEYLPLDRTVLTYDSTKVCMVLLGTIMVVMLTVLILFINSKSMELSKPLFFVGGLGTVVTMGFSPTLLESGDRALIICTLCLIMVMYMILDEYVLCLK